MVWPWARNRAGAGSPLLADLKKATESGVIEVPKELLSIVVQASHGEEERREIMQHLRSCLAEPSSRQWRRIYAGLLLVEDLAKNGSPELLVETSEGRHFDLVQRISFLEKFECMDDRRVQNMVRTKASALRTEIVERLQTAGEGRSAEPAAKDAAPSQEVASVGSSASTAAEAGGHCCSDDAPPWRPPEGQMVLNGIVTVGHTDDTTSESSGGEGPRKAVHYREARRAPLKTRRERGRRASGSSSDSDAPAGDGCKAQPAPPPPPPPPPAPPAAETVDLLGF